LLHAHREHRDLDRYAGSGGGSGGGGGLNAANARISKSELALSKAAAQAALLRSSGYDDRNARSGLSNNTLSHPSLSREASHRRAAHRDASGGAAAPSSHHSRPNSLSASAPVPSSRERDHRDRDREREREQHRAPASQRGGNEDEYAETGVESDEDGLLDADGGGGVLDEDDASTLSESDSATSDLPAGARSRFTVDGGGDGDSGHSAAGSVYGGSRDAANGVPLSRPGSSHRRSGGQASSAASGGARSNGSTAHSQPQRSAMAQLRSAGKALLKNNRRA